MMGAFAPRHDSQTTLKGAVMADEKSDNVALIDVRYLLDTCRDINHQIEQLATNHGIKFGSGLDPNVIQKLEELVKQML
jgi:hypothetical protein